MTFVTVLALAVATLVAAPWFAHRLRRQRAEEHRFAPARLATATPPKARRRSQLEHKALFGIRAAAVVALALLSASPLVKCSRLALARSLPFPGSIAASSFGASKKKSSSPASTILSISPQVEMRSRSVGSILRAIASSYETPFAASAIWRRSNAS